MAFSQAAGISKLIDHGENARLGGKGSMVSPGRKLGSIC